MAVTTRLDQDRLNELLGKMIDDIGATISAPLMLIGDRLGLYAALAEGGPQTPDELGVRTGTAPVYIRPWLVNQAARGYIDYDGASGRYSLSPEQVLVLADESSPAFVVGGFEALIASSMAVDRIAEAFRTGGGMAWGEHHPSLFRGVERFFRPGYLANIAASWIPAIEGMIPRLEAGGVVADVGCGHGASTIIMAQAYPHAHFVGFDLHAGSIEQARQRAEQAGVADRVAFRVVDAAEIPGADGGYDLIAYFDCLHDMGDPAGVLRRAREALGEGGAVMLVEPMAWSNTEDNFNPIGRMAAASSVMLCTPHGSVTGGNGLGTLATDDEIRAVAETAGFRRFRRATETPFNRIFEVRP